MRTSKLTFDLQEELVRKIERGVPVRQACALLSTTISVTTFKRWMKRGGEEAERIDNGETPRESEVKHLLFFVEVERARAKRVETHADTLYYIATGDIEELTVGDATVAISPKMLAVRANVAKWSLERLESEMSDKPDAASAGASLEKLLVTLSELYGFTVKGRRFDSEVEPSGDEWTPPAVH